jgi:hypothetical protein
MKKYILLVGLTFCIGATGLAQELRLNAYSGYVFDDRFETFNSDVSFLDGTIRGGYQWGAGLEFLLSDYYGAELIYYRQDTEVPVNYFENLNVSRTLDASVNYILLGATRYAGTDRVQGYISPMAGLVIYNNKNPEPTEPGSYTKFAWGVKLGGNIWATEKVGLKLQMQLLSAVQVIGGSFYLGTGGSGAGISTFSTLYQFTLGGGIYLPPSR